MLLGLAGERVSGSTNEGLVPAAAVLPAAVA
jgi:hypothetical protein